MNVIPHKGAKALVWLDGTLYDVAAGWRSIPLDGSPGSAKFGEYGPQFDAAVAAPKGDVVALVASTGTKALLLAPDGRIIRELNRSYYQAEAYRYPLALWTLPDGRTALAHCPTEYNQLELEVATTGEPLTTGDRSPVDFFYSRLAVSPSGRYLLSAGWVWHPWECLAVYDLPAALTDPTTLDAHHGVFDLHGLVQAEVAGACFLGDDVAVSTSPEENDPETDDDLAPNMLARWSPTTGTFTWRTQLTEPAGDLVPFGDDILALYRHPRLYDGTTGDLIAEWPDLDTGEAVGSIVWDKAFSGPARVAVDAAGNRFAVTDGGRITLVDVHAKPKP